MSSTPFDYLVVGGGPGGVAAAHFLSEEGFKVVLAEQRPRLGSKPCGGGVPYHINMIMPLPSDSIKNTIKSMTLHFNMREAGSWYAGKTIFYMIDRSVYLEHFSTNFDVELKTPVKINDKFATFKNSKVELSKVIIATGYSWRMKEREMLAQTIQYYFEGVKVDDPSNIDFYFFDDLVGYAWVFPYGDNEVKVGIGGLGVTVPELQARLDKLVEALNFDKSKITRIDGAPIDMGGIKLEWATDPTYVVGEALGAVMPLTGEGIRPSILTAKSLAYSISHNKDYKKVLKDLKIYKVGTQQVKILKKVKKDKKLPKIDKLSPRAIETIYKFGLGEARLNDFLSSLPFSLSLLKSLL